MYHTIFVPVDGPDGHSTVQHAMQLARLLGSRVVLATLVRDQELQRSAEARLVSLSRLGRLSPQCLVRLSGESDAPQRYADLIREARASLVVLGPSSPLTSTLPDLTQTPVLLVPRTAAPSAGARWLAAGRQRLMGGGPVETGPVEGGRTKEAASTASR
jgi:hypothetical protein